MLPNVSQLSRSLGLVTEMYQFTMNYQETEMFQLTKMPKLRLGAVSWSVPSSNVPGDLNVYGTAGLFPECHFDTFPCDEICHFNSEFQRAKISRNSFCSYLFFSSLEQIIRDQNPKKYSLRENPPSSFLKFSRAKCHWNYFSSQFLFCHWIE